MEMRLAAFTEIVKKVIVKSAEIRGWGKAEK